MKKILVLALLLSSFSLLAKNKVANAPIAKAPVPKTDGVEVYQAYDKAEKPNVTKRQIASNSHLSESDLSPEFKKFRDEFLTIKTADQLDSFLNRISVNYSHYPNDVKVVASNLLMLKPLRGIEVRSKKLLDSHTSAARRLKMIVGHALRNVDLFYNVDQGQVLREFVSTLPKSSTASAIPSISHFQNYLVLEVMPVLDHTARNISAIEKSIDNNTYYVFDNKFTYGSESFQDGMLRFRSYGKAELNFMLTNIYATLHEMSFVSAYDLNDLFVVSDLLKYDQIFTKFIGFSFLGVAEERVNAVKKNKGFLKFREENFSKKMMSNSYIYLTQAVDGAIKTWNLINERPYSTNLMINDEKMKSSYDKTNIALTNLASLIEDKGFHPIRSHVTGEVVFVNLNAFFNNPPRDLSVFLPNKFDNKYGKATGWNLASISPYVKSNEAGLDSMDKVVRVLSQASGGKAISQLYLSL